MSDPILRKHFIILDSNEANKTLEGILERVDRALNPGKYKKEESSRMFSKRSLFYNEERSRSRSKSRVGNQGNTGVLDCSVDGRGSLSPKVDLSLGGGSGKGGVLLP